ncbi:hypothetical protein ACFFRR_007021 [Megaselia abdita]
MVSTKNELSGSALPVLELPPWVKQEYFENIAAEEFENLSKVTKFTAESGSAPGENYASVILRIIMECELKDGSNKSLSLMVKTTHPASSMGGQLTQQLGVFPRETEVYESIIPAFEKMYLDKGKKVVFGPKHYKLAKDPGQDTVVLEDLEPRKFKNANRFEGFDLDHTESVLKLLAEYHAASAVYHETVGPFPEKFNTGLFDRSKKEMFVQVFVPLFAGLKQIFGQFVENGKHFCELMYPDDIDVMVEQNLKLGDINPEEFNVLNHGDSWCNNVMFKYNDKGEREETILVDFQMGKYGTPCQDLFYFIFTSVKQELRLTKFDYFIKYYHDNLKENLTLLGYKKPIPTLNELHIMLLKKSKMACNAFGTLAMALFDVGKLAGQFKSDDLLSKSLSGVDFKQLMFTNPAYIKCLNECLPWLENRGML